MNCKKCGAQNDDNAYKCVQCGDILRQDESAEAGQKISNYLIPSILVTLLCCLPLGIPAIVYAAQVNAKIESGDIEGAKKASGQAKLWTFISLGAGLLCAVIYLALMMLGAIGSKH